jgi:DNA-binding transcriptional ArsR family regulator
MQDASKQPKPTEPEMERALSHPTRLEIFGHLTRRGATGEAQLVEELDLVAGRVRYHLSVLESANLIAYVEAQGHGAAGRYVAAV